MTHKWLTALFARGPLTYTGWLAGKHYSTQWTTRGEAPETDRFAFDLLLEIDPAAAGMGGPQLRQRCRLVTDTQGRPLLYEREVGAARTRFAFTPSRVEVTLGDGSTIEVARASAEFVFDRSLPGLLALALGVIREQVGFAAPVTIELFDVTQLAPVPYTFKPESGRVLRTSHREVLEVEGGRLSLYSLPASGIQARLALPGPPLPPWRTDPLIAEPPLAYKPPPHRTFRLKDIRIPVGDGSWIGATLTIPQAPFAAALFLSGSGTHDRHGISGALDIGTHEVMDALAEAGVLGLRFDTRGGGETPSGSDVLNRGLEDRIADARLCLGFFRAQPDVADLPLFLIGHSEGALVAMEIAASSAVDGIVAMAGPGRRIDALIGEQIAAQARRAGLSEEIVANRGAELAEFVRVIEEDRSWVAGEVPDYLFSALRSRKWFREHLKRSPTALVAMLRCPVLICQGDNDFQVSVERDSLPLLAAAEAAGVDVTFARFPALDHLFKPIEGESTVQSYFDTTRHVDRAFLSTVERWLRSASKRTPRP